MKKLLIATTAFAALATAASAQSGGVLNVLGRFAAAAVAPVILNLVMIAVLLWYGGEPVALARVLALALPVAGVLQLLLLWQACRNAGAPIRPRTDLADLVAPDRFQRRAARKGGR